VYTSRIKTVTKTPPFSDIDLEHWQDYPHLQTDSLWLWGKRESDHPLDYPGTFIPQVARQLIERYTKAGELVLDMFIGSGTTADVALALDRQLIGLDLNYDQVGHLGRTYAKHPTLSFICGDATDTQTIKTVHHLLDLFGVVEPHLVIMHPPYWDIIQYSDHPDDLSNTADLGAFLQKMTDLAIISQVLLEPGRFAALVMGDKYQDGQTIPLGFLSMQQFTQAGYILKAINVKNIAGNEAGSGGKKANLWRYRALAQGFSVFRHEYVFIFQKKP
jgi:hypothetical protein